ncbi:MAG: hypothetical protein ACTSP9_00420 [Promethearchaeota archaeon]
MANTFGIIALIFGIIGLCCGWIISYIGIVFPIVAIVCGAIGIKKDDSSGMSIAGLVLGIISIMCIVLMTMFILVLIQELMGIGAFI